MIDIKPYCVLPKEMTTVAFELFYKRREGVYIEIIREISDILSLDYEAYFPHIGKIEFYIDEVVHNEIRNVKGFSFKEVSQKAYRRCIEEVLTENLFDIVCNSIEKYLVYNGLSARQIEEFNIKYVVGYITVYDTLDEAIEKADKILFQ